MSEALGADLYLGRQPILDRHQQLVAYELLFRSGDQNVATVLDGRLATSTVIRNLFSEISVGDVLGRYRGFINVDEETLFSDTLELLPPASVVLEVLETVSPTPAVVARCAELKAQGFTLALDDVVQLTEPFAPLLPHIDIVKVDLKGVPAHELPALAAAVKRLGRTLLAEKVDTRDEMQRCHDLGFDLFQGYYFARPVIIQGRALDPSQLAMLRLINLLLSDAHRAELEEVFKQDPALSIGLLRMTNSVAMGLHVRVTSLGHAITLLGRRQLQRWLQLLLYTTRNGKGSTPLLQLAATRARLMELLAEKVAVGDTTFADNAFMTGILSLTPALFNQAIDDVVAALKVSQDVEVALCRRAGRHGDLLALAEALEEGRPEPLDQALARLPGLQMSDISLLLATSLAWANNVDQAA